MHIRTRISTMIRQQQEAVSRGELIDQTEQKKASEDLAKVMFEAASAARFRNAPIIHWFSGRFYFEFTSNMYLGFVGLQKVDTMHPPLDLQYLVFRQRTQAVEKLAERSDPRDIVAYTMSQRHAKLALIHDCDATRARNRFWKEILGEIPDEHLLLEHGIVISREMWLAQTHYEQAIRLDPTSTKLMRRFASFLREVVNQPTQASQIEARANEIDSQMMDERVDATNNPNAAANVIAQRVNTTNDFVLSGRFRDLLFTGSNAVIVITAREGFLGTITWANRAAMRMFEYSEGSILGTNVSRLMPEPFASAHDSMMRRNLTRNVSKFVDSERQLLGKTRSGFIIPLDVIIKAFSEDGTSMSFLAVLSAIHVANSHYVLATKDGMVTAVSRGVIDIFPVSATDVSGGTVRLVDIFPDFDREREAYCAPGGRAVHLASNSVDLRVTVEEFSYAGGHAVDQIDIVVTRKLRRQRVHKAYGRRTALMNATPGNRVGFLNVITEGGSNTDNAGEVDETAVSNNQQLNEGETGLTGVQEDKGEASSSEDEQIESSSDATTTTEDVEEKAGDVGEPEASEDSADSCWSSESSSTDAGAIWVSSNQSTGSSGAHIWSRGSNSRGNADSGDSKNESIATDTTTILEDFRREVSSGKKTRAIRHLRVVFLASMALAATASVAVFVILTVVLNKHIAQVEHVRDAGERRIATVTMAYNAHWLALIQAGIADASKQQFVRDELRASADNLLSVDSMLHADAAAYSNDQQRIMVQPVVPMKDVVDGVPLSSDESLWDVDMLLAQKSRLLARGDANEESRDAYATRFVLENALGPIENRMNESVKAFERRGDAVVSAVKLVTQILLLSTTAIMFLVVMQVLRPTIRTIESSKATITSIFMRVPTLVARSLVSSSERRLEQLHREIEDSHGLSVGDGENNETNDHEHSDTDESRAASESGDSATPVERAGSIPDKPRKRPGHRSRRRRHRLQEWLVLISMSLVFVICVVYFAVVYFYALASIEPALVNSPSEFNWASHRTFTARRLLLLLRVLATPNATAITTTPDDVRNELLVLERQHYGLTYGEGELGLAGTVREDSTQDPLLFGEACGFDQTVTTPWDTIFSCEAFSHGVMASGLHSALLDFLERGREALATIEKRCYQPGNHTLQAATVQVTSCTDASVQKEILQDIELDSMQEMERGFLFIALQQSQELFSKDLTFGHFVAFRLTMTALSAFSIFLVSVTYFKVYKPNQSALQEQVRRTRSLLLMLPADIAV